MRELDPVTGMKLPPRGSVEWSTEPEDPGRRRGGRPSLVFQRDTVLRWRTVEHNVGIGLDFTDISREEREDRITSLLRLVRMEAFRKAYPRRRLLPEHGGRAPEQCIHRRVLTVRGPAELGHSHRLPRLVGRRRAPVGPQVDAMLQGGLIRPR